MRISRAVGLVGCVVMAPGLVLAESGVVHASVTPVVVSSPAPISPPDATPAGVSRQLVVSGLTGAITDLDVSFDASGTFPNDLDIAVQGPSGQVVMLMSDDCGSLDVSAAHLVFDDEATSAINSVPDLSGCSAGGRFKPTLDAEPDDAAFPVPTSTVLSVFDGDTANGTWTLFVADDAAADDHTLPSGFSLSFTGVALPDNTAPGTRLVKKPHRLTTRRRATFGFTATETGSHFQCKLDKSSWRACSSPKVVRRVKIGRHVFRVRAIDVAGNRDATPAIARWRRVRS